MIKLVKVKQTFYDFCKENSVDEELLFNEKGRPCVLVLKLKYRGLMTDFIVPLRSNISPTIPGTQYFNLPPNPNTKPKHHHGVHYIKLFPIDRKYIDTYVTSGDKYYSTILNILNRKEKDIVDACQAYLKECENGNKHSMTPNLDGILTVLGLLKED